MAVSTSCSFRVTLSLETVSNVICRFHVAYRQLNVTRYWLEWFDVFRSVVPPCVRSQHYRLLISARYRPLRTSSLVIIIIMVVIVIRISSPVTVGTTAYLLHLRSVCVISLFTLTSALWPHPHRYNIGEHYTDSNLIRSPVNDYTEFIRTQTKFIRTNWWVWAMKNAKSTASVIFVNEN